MNIKQLFCKHVWKETSKEFLFKEKEEWGVVYYAMFSHFASHRKCIKCGKDKVVETRVVNL